MENLLNILGNSNKDIDNQKLMDYLHGKLSAQDHHEVEKWMLENEFASEAVEGLQKLKGNRDVNVYVDQLNKQLHHYLEQKKQRRQRRQIKNIPWTYLAIFLILIFIILAYVVIRQAGQ